MSPEKLSESAQGSDSKSGSKPGSGSKPRRSPYEPGSKEWRREAVQLAEARNRLAWLGIEVSLPSLYRWAQDGLIPTSRLGRYRTTVEAIEAALRPAEVA